MRWFGTLFLSSSLPTGRHISIDFKDAAAAIAPRPRRLAVGGVGGAPPSLLRGLLTKVPRRTELTAQVDGEAWSFPFAGERIEVSLKGRVGVRFGRASHRPMAVAAALM